MALNVKFEISADVISTEAQLGETLLMNTRTLGYFGLDPLGSQFWRAMQASDDADEVVRTVEETSGRSRDELEPVLQSILSGMERLRLLSLAKKQA